MRLLDCEHMMRMRQTIETFSDPMLGATWRELGAIRHAEKLDGRWHADIELGYPTEGLDEEYSRAVAAWLDDEVILGLKFRVPETKGIPGVKNIIAIASGKGGVGKSTVAVNLALALSHLGAKTGILDADIYGPSQGIMLGVPEGRRPDVKDDRFVPIKKHGIEAMSMSMLVTEKTPMVWRGPMVSGALQQLINQSAWTDLDYLIVDMPPGTGDIQLTLSQSVPVGGAVIVTTPQDIALADARKGIEMFSKVDIPILGIIENMSFFTCDKCGERHHLFGVDGGIRVAEEYDTDLLGAFPLAQRIREETDAGRPTVAGDPDGEIASQFRNCARLTAAKLWQTLGDTSVGPTIKMDDS